MSAADAGSDRGLTVDYRADNSSKQRPFLGNIGPFIDSIDETIQTYWRWMKPDPMWTHQTARFILDELLSLPLEQRMAAMGMERVEGFTTRETDGAEEPMWRPVWRCSSCDGDGYVRRPDPERLGMSKAVSCDPCGGTGKRLAVEA